MGITVLPAKPFQYVLIKSATLFERNHPLSIQLHAERDDLMVKQETAALVYDEFSVFGAGRSAGLQDDRCLTDATNVAIPVRRWRVSSSGGKQ